MATSLALGPSEPLRVLRQHCVVCKYQDLTTAGRSRKCEWLVFWNDQSLSFYRRARSLDNCQLFVGAFVFLLGVGFGYLVRRSVLRSRREYLESQGTWNMSRLNLRDGGARNFMHLSRFACCPANGVTQHDMTMELLPVFNDTCRFAHA